MLEATILSQRYHYTVLDSIYLSRPSNTSERPPMRIVKIEDSPIHSLAYLKAGQGGRTENAMLYLHRATTESLPASLSAILITSDLQGVVNHPKGSLLGEQLAEDYAMLASSELVPPPEATGVLLAGDLYSAENADIRGATGEVFSVWEAFSTLHKWVAGVAGNHDILHSDDIARLENSYLLDANSIELDGLQISGLSSVIGNHIKHGRREESEYLGQLEALLAGKPDVLITHESPMGGSGQKGKESIRKVMESNPPKLGLCGHVHWSKPLLQLSSSSQILNTDARAFLLVPSTESPS